MSKPIFEDLCVFAGRRDRESYGILQIVTVAVILAIAVAFAIASNVVEEVTFAITSSSRDADTAVEILFVPLAIATLIAGFCGIPVTMQRLRDLGYSGWMFLPILFLIICVFSSILDFSPTLKGISQCVCVVIWYMLTFKRGMRGTNKYGADPHNRLLNINFWQTSTLEDIKTTIKRDGDVHAHDESEWTPLHMAVAFRPNSEITSMLLDEGVNIEARTEDGLTPLHLAARWNFTPKTIQVLLSKGADIAVRDKGGKTPFDYAKENKHLIASPIILKRLKDVGKKETESAFMLEAKFWETATVEDVVKILDSGANIEACDSNGATPLLLAAGINKTPEVTSLLLGRGADIQTRDKRGWTALHRAVVSPLPSLVRESYPITPELISLLLDRGADIEAKAEGGLTPLHRAVVDNQHLEIIARWSLDRSYDIEERLAVADRQKLENVSLLLDKGADIEARTESGFTPLHFAAGCAPEVLSLLLDAGADIKARDSNGATPLHWAVEKSKNWAKKGKTPEEVISLLLDRGANIEARTEDGRTPFFAAVKSENIEMIALFIDRGANIEDRAENGGTPLHAAVAFSKTPAIVELLLDKGANPKAQNNDGRTPFDLAKENEHLKGSVVYWRLNDAQYQ